MRKFCMDDEPVVCPRFSTLGQLFRSTCTRALRKATESSYIKEGYSSLKDFISSKSDDLFHLWKRDCCCGYTGHKTPLKTVEWYGLFDRPGGRCPKKYALDCPHKYSAKASLTLDSLEFSLACLLLYNLCPSIPKSDIESLRSIRNEVFHSNQESLDETEFERLWKSAHYALCKISDAVSTEFQTQIKKECDDMYNEVDKYHPILRRHIENTLCIVEEHEKDETFLKPRNVDLILKTLEKSGLSVIVGPPGSGKTKIGLEILRVLKTQHDPAGLLLIEDASKWKSVVDPKKAMVVMLDDCLGKSSATISAFEAIPFNTINACIRRGSVKVLMTFRSSVYESYRRRLLEKKLFEENNIIDLSTEMFQLTTEEKKSLLTKYLIYKNVKVTRTKEEARKAPETSIDQWTINDISHLNPYDFPLLCYMFTSQKHFFELGLHFFRLPRRTIVEDIDSLRKSKDQDKILQYITLGYIAIHDNFINISKLDGNILKFLLMQFGLDCTVLNINIQVEDAVKELCKTYLKPLPSDRNSYQFVHPTFLESTILSCGRVFPELIIQQCSKTTLSELIRTQSYEEKEEENVLKLHKHSYKALAHRFVREMKDECASIKLVLFHQSMSDTEFVPELYEDLKTSFPLEANLSRGFLLESCKYGITENVEFCMKFEELRELVDESLEIASYHNHAEIVRFLMQISKSHAIETQFLQACSFNCMDVVKVMIKHVSNSCIKNGLIRACKACRPGRFNIIDLLVDSTNNTRIAETHDLFQPLHFIDAKRKVGPQKTHSLFGILIKEAICVERNDIIQHLLNNYNFEIAGSDLINIVVMCCHANMVILAKDFLQKFFEFDEYYVKALLEKCRFCRRLVQVLIDLKDVLHLEEYILSPDFMQTDWGQIGDRDVIEKLFEVFSSQLIHCISQSPKLIVLLFSQGYFQVISGVLAVDENIILGCASFIEKEKKTTLLEYAVFCGFPDFGHFIGEEDQTGSFLSTLFDKCLKGYTSYRNSYIYFLQRDADAYRDCLHSIYRKGNGNVKFDKNIFFEIIRMSSKYEKTNIAVLQLLMDIDQSVVQCKDSQELCGEFLLPVELAAFLGKYQIMTILCEANPNTVNAEKITQLVNGKENKQYITGKLFDFQKIRSFIENKFMR